MEVFWGVNRQAASLPQIAKTAVLFFSLLALAACSTNRATGRQTFTAFMSEAQEMKVGREEHPKIIKAYGGEYGSAALRAYVGALGDRLSKVSELPHMHFTFTILNDSTVNAFALPGGYVYVTRGLLAVASDEAQLAGVLSHEIGHITARHTAQRYSQAQVANIGVTVLDVLGSAAGLPMGVGDVASFGAEAVLKGYSREQEMEADKLGVRYMSRAGYDPNAMISFFRKLEADTKLMARIAGNPQDGAPNIMATHPRTEKRIAQAIALAGVAHGGKGIHHEAAYLKAITGIVFGDDPAQGIVLNRRFMHPELKIAFTLPEGFHADNTPSNLVARNDAGARIVFDMAPRDDVAKAPSLGDYVVRVWGGGLNASSLQRITVNGMAGATAMGRVRTQSGVRDVRLVAIRERPGRVYRFLFLTPPALTGRLATALKRTTYSFARLSADEAARIHPRTIQIRTVRPGDSVQSLARAMAVDNFKEAWFDVLNGVRRDQDLAVGMKVKVIAE
ncbi:M48 family metalloprotease [Varunaivibrio sulfuroxidans]|uniref:Putative Zn-dependent protease n=1 Tax=Varunaivibrio sulfuroxidans TaxID=1773489 RepID=A0A4R3JE06_9PROT|nr:M48 family metalloprotease [Varunaivibrio sulfuroxidans]TCS63665.1 putative Zn-dependent protease [Varunaivibrio sulfuroxidans]WES30197.1 M48 family metalloprotease [Varunaivibrio sulfuroxidans]